MLVSGKLPFRTHPTSLANKIQVYSLYDQRYHVGLWDCLKYCKFPRAYNLDPWVCRIPSVPNNLNSFILVKYKMTTWLNQAMKRQVKKKEKRKSTGLASMNEGIISVKTWRATSAVGITSQTTRLVLAVFIVRVKAQDLLKNIQLIELGHEVGPEICSLWRIWQ